MSRNIIFVKMTVVCLKTITYKPSIKELSKMYSNRYLIPVIKQYWNSENG
jgi:hypothetical protein